MLFTPSITQFIRSWNETPGIFFYSAFRVENDSWIIFVISLIHTIVMTDPNIKYYSFTYYLLLYCYALPYLLFLLLVVAKDKETPSHRFIDFFLLLSYTFIKCAHSPALIQQNYMFE